MAVARPKTLRQAQKVYDTNSELAWWVFMRVSGLALIFLTFGHLFMTNILIDAGKIDFTFVASRLSNPLIKIYDTFLLGLAMLHGVNGLRYSLEDYISARSGRFMAKVLVYSLMVAVFVFGIMALWATDFSQFEVVPAGDHG